MFPVGVASSSRGPTYANEARDRAITGDLKISVTGHGEGIIKRRELARRSPGTLIPGYNVAIDEHPLEAPRTPRGSRQAGRAWMRACAMAPGQVDRITIRDNEFHRRAARQKYTPSGNGMSNICESRVRAVYFEKKKKKDIE